MNTWRVKDTGHGSYQVLTSSPVLPVYPFAGHGAKERAESHAIHLNDLEASAWPDPEALKAPTELLDQLVKMLRRVHPELSKLVELPRYMETAAKFLNVDLHRVVED